MKTCKFYLTLAVMLLPLCGWAQEKLFDKYNNMKDVKSVYISKAMLDMGPHYFTDFYLGSTAKKLNSVRVLSTSNASVYKEMLKDIRALLKHSKYELLMKQKGASNSSEFFIAKSHDKIKELIMLMVVNDQSLRFMHLEGDMTEKDVKDILLYQGTSATDSLRSIPQLEDLKHLNNLTALEDLKKWKGWDFHIDEDTWKEFEQQMENLREYLKDWDVEISSN